MTPDRREPQITDDNFATIVKVVELGRGLYDNLTKYIRVEMGCLFGFVTTFLGAGIFNIAGGVPFLPLQTLWVSFTIQVPRRAVACSSGSRTASEGRAGRHRQPSSSVGSGSCG